MKRTISTVDLVQQAKCPKTNTTDYSRCIICQGQSDQVLHTVTLVGLNSLKTAAEARKDDTALRLEEDLSSDTFLTEKQPSWHRHCRNWYTLKKSYELAKRKCNAREEPSVSKDPC